MGHYDDARDRYDDLEDAYDEWLIKVRKIGLDVKTLEKVKEIRADLNSKKRQLKDLPLQIKDLENQMPKLTPKQEKALAERPPWRH